MVQCLCRMATFSEYAKKKNPWPGQGGVEVYPKCYRGRFEYCGWQLLGGSSDVAPQSVGTVSVNPTVVEHFDPRSMYMFGIDPAAPGTNLRFTVGAITVGGEPQWANNNPRPTGLGSELLSDVFNRSDQPLLIYNWAIFSTPALGSPLVFDVFNLNAVTLRIYISIWGNAMTNEFVRKWQEAEEDGDVISVVQTKPIDTYEAFTFVREKKKSKKRRRRRKNKK